MTTALTVSTANALTINTVPMIERVYVKPARDGSEIIDRIREASASLSDIHLFLRVMGKKLIASDFPVIEYALARARYRENLDLSIEHVAILTQMTVEKVRRYYDRLQIRVGERVTNQQVSALMTAVADYS